ncbi:MAG: hypothetical protein ACK56I_26840, partial [bacterium]
GLAHLRLQRGCDDRAQGGQRREPERRLPVPDKGQHQKGQQVEAEPVKDRPRLAQPRQNDADQPRLHHRHRNPEQRERRPHHPGRPAEGFLGEIGPDRRIDDDGEFIQEAEAQEPPHPRQRR